jgi:DNA polymerase III subunit delta
MPVLEQDVLLSQLAAGRFEPVYLVIGDDEIARDDMTKAFQAAVPEDVQPFAFERRSALDASTKPEAIVASARTPPFIGDRRVIVVTRAERWFKPKSKDDGAGDDEDDAGGYEVLEAYFERPDPLATVVFAATDVNRTLRVVKALLKVAHVVECWGLRPEKSGFGAAQEVLTRAGRFVSAALKRRGLTIDRGALEPLLAHAGSDISILRGDVERLALYCHGRKTVALEDVAAVVSGTALLDPWSIINAIERGDARAALRQVQILTDADEPPYKTLGQIAWWVRSKLPQMGAPDRVRAAVDAVFRTDLAMKSSGGEPRILLEKLVVELCDRAARARSSGAITR